MKSTIIISLLATLATAFPTTFTSHQGIAKHILARAPPEANALLKSVTSSGNGCASNSAQFLIADNATVAFDALVVDTINAGSNANKRCIISIDLQLDPAWKYTINKESTVQGWTDGIAAALKLVYTVGGTTSESGSNIKPQRESNFKLKFKSEGATSAYGGGVATIDFSVALIKDGDKQGVFAVDSLDIAFAYSK